MIARAEGSKASTALLCDLRGMVLDVMCDGLDIAGTIALGQSWLQIVDEESRQKGLNFQLELQSRRAAGRWELNALVGDEVSPLSLCGVVQGEQMTIVAAETNDDGLRLLEELARINNDQTNVLRATLKENVRLSNSQVQRDSALYDELSRLNNELVTLQRQLAKRTAELEQLNELKSQFLGIAAHDLRSPLGAIIAYSEFLIDEASDTLSEEHGEFLRNIRSSSEFMLQLVDDFLDVSVIESGRLRLNLDPVDLIALVKQNVVLNRPLAEAKGIHLSVHSDEPGLEMLLDAAKIEQVLNNLISNAVKFSYPGSTTEVHVAKREDGGSRTALTDPGSSSAIISVSDQGQGIPAGEMEKLFGLYETTTVRGTDGEKSSGLGLAIARRIVEGHRGQISAESTVGQGTTFFISLPIADDTSDQQESESE